MKRSFSLLEIILCILIISIAFNFFVYTKVDNRVYDASNRLLIYLKELRYQALIDNKKNISDKKWHKKRWTLKFQKCRESVGGIYYTIYTDENKLGHANKDESMLDPLTKKRIYTSNLCEQTKDTSKYVLLTKEYGIKKVNLSCNDTSSLGQISFGTDGKIYSKLSNYEDSAEEYEIKNTCYIEFVGEGNNSKTIAIEPKSGFSYIL